MNLIKIVKKDKKDTPSTQKIVKINTKKEEEENGHVSAIHL